MERPVYIVCGGTGGHLAPGIATAQRLRGEGIPVKLVVSEKEIDGRLLQAYPDIPYIRASGAPFILRPRALMTFIRQNLRGLLGAYRVLRREDPPVLIAFGGFLTVAYAAVAWFLHIPVVLHEANRIPGRSIRLLSGLADLVLLPDGVGIPGMDRRRVRHLGMPLRAEVKHTRKETIREKMRIPLSAKVLVVAGGSQGAEALNQWVQRHHRVLAADGIWTLLVAGPGKVNLPEVSRFLSDKGETVETRTWEFHPSMHDLFSCADVVISRAGAGTIAELIICLTPGLLVPYPHAADGHQEANARYLERRGAAILVDQDDLGLLYREVLDVIYNDWLQGKMRTNLRRLNDEGAAGTLARLIHRTYLTPSGPSGPSAAAPSTQTGLNHG